MVPPFADAILTEGRWPRGLGRGDRVQCVSAWFALLFQWLTGCSVVEGSLCHRFRLHVLDQDLRQERDDLLFNRREWGYRRSWCGVGALVLSAHGRCECSTLSLLMYYFKLSCLPLRSWTRVLMYARSSPLYPCSRTVQAETTRPEVSVIPTLLIAIKGSC